MTFAVSLLAVAAAGCERAMTHLHGGDRSHQAAVEQSGPATADLQGGYNEWRASPFIHQFYDLTKTAFADGADKVDFATYQEKSYAIFRAFGGSNGGGKAGEEAMLDHLKGIPLQMVGIVKDDPSVLETYDKFWVALAGPP
jgi:hypothetical protein